MAHRKNTVQTLAEREAEAEALRLRLAGLPFAEIARRQGSKHASTAWRRVQAALRDTVPLEDVDLLRRLESERLDYVQVRLFAALEAAQRREDVDGVIKASTAFVKIAERRSRLLGLDAPVRTDVRISGAMEAEIETLVAELTALPPIGQDEQP